MWICVDDCAHTMTLLSRRSHHSPSRTLITFISIQACTHSFYKFYIFWKEKTCWQRVTVNPFDYGPPLLVMSMERFYIFSSQSRKETSSISFPFIFTATLIIEKRSAFSFHKGVWFCYLCTRSNVVRLVMTGHMPEIPRKRVLPSLSFKFSTLLIYFLCKFSGTFLPNCCIVVIYLFDLLILEKCCSVCRQTRELKRC